MNEFSAWVDKKKRSGFYSLFGSWNRRFMKCDATEIHLCTENHVPSHSIPIKHIDRIFADEASDCECTIITNIRSFTFRLVDKECRDQCVAFLTAAKTKLDREKEKRLSKVKEDLNKYVASLHINSIIGHLRIDET
jgi:hypothetical protein